MEGGTDITLHFLDPIRFPPPQLQLVEECRYKEVHAHNRLMQISFFNVHLPSFQTHNHADIQEVKTWSNFPHFFSVCLWMVHTF